MQFRTFTRLLSLLLVLSLCAGMVLPAMAAAPDTAPTVEVQKVEDMPLAWKSPLTAGSNPVKSDVSTPAHAADDIVRVSILLSGKSTVDAGFKTTGIASNSAAMAYRSELRRQQDAMVDTISRVALNGEALDVVWKLNLAANMISANVPYGKLDAIRSIPGVAKVCIEQKFELTEKNTEVAPNMATSADMIASPIAWESGLKGAGTTIAIIDTGLDIDHQSFDPDAFAYAIAEDEAESGIQYHLMTAEDIAEVLPQTNLHFFDETLTADDLYWNKKVPFAYNYVDLSDYITHDYDYQSAHGSHVAGIASANRYLKQGSGYVDSMESAGIQGVAPDAQLIIMKVFGYSSPYESDYLAALEDAVLLGADSINLSLGSSNPGYIAIESELQQILDNLRSTDTVVTISASNSGAWSDYSGTYLTSGGRHLEYAEDVNMDTVGSPGSYTNALTVASVENCGSTSNYMLFGNYKIAFNETSYANLPLRTLAGSHDFVMISGFGTEADFDALGDALEGKIAIVPRGEINMFEKAENAISHGAIATIIYNSSDDALYVDLEDYTQTAPVVTISLTDATYLANNATPVFLTETTGYWTGTLTITNGAVSSGAADGDYTMSTFSSWGVPGDLSLKPEITTPGGKIYSVDGSSTLTNGYITMSGTSMAAPQMAGLSALFAQYYRENELNTDLTLRQLSQSLMMSTAVPMKDSEGHYYAVMQQGAGLANIGEAIRSDTYIVMDADATASASDGKVKAELGDDPDRTGSYSFSFTLNNMSSVSSAFSLSAEFFTQGYTESYVNSNYSAMGGYMLKSTTPLDTTTLWIVDGELLTADGSTQIRDFNGDGMENAADVQALLDYATGVRTSISNANLSDLDGDGDTDSYDAYLLLTGLDGSGNTVIPANSSVEIQVLFSLTAAQKADLDSKFSNGAYVEGYVFATAETGEDGDLGITHSIPVLGFYGSWTDSSMYDRGNVWTYYLEIEDYDPYIPYNTWTNFLEYSTPAVPETSIYGGYEFGSSPENYAHSAFNSTDGSSIRRINFSNIRNATDAKIQVRNTETNEIYYEKYLGAQGGAFYYVNAGGWYDISKSLAVGWRGTDLNGNPVPNNTPAVMELILAPEYYVTDDGVTVDWDALGDGAVMSFPMYIDNEAPVVLDAQLSSSDKLTLTLQDNYFIGGIDILDSNGYSALPDYSLLSCEQAEPGEITTLTIDLSEYNEDVYTIQVIDYATNYSTYRLFFHTPSTDTVDGIALDRDTAQIVVGHSLYLYAELTPYNLSDTSVTWTTDDPSIATVNNAGLVTAHTEGTCTITATSVLDPTKAASCTVSAINLDKTLAGAVMNEDGHTEWSGITISKLPDRTPLTEEATMTQFASATMDKKGHLYASTVGLGSSMFYELDPDTFAPIAGAMFSDYGDVYYADMTWAPHIGGGTIMAVYQDQIFRVDQNNGLYYTYTDDNGNLAGEGRHWKFSDDYDMENMLGIAYCGSYYFDTYEAYMDYFYILASDGIVSKVGIMEVDGEYYFTALNRTEADVVMDTGLYLNSTYFYDSIYYDGNLLYWSYYENGDSTTTFYAISADSAEPAIYELGTLDYNIWPMTGLFEREPEYPDWDTASIQAPAAVYAKEAETDALEPTEIAARRVAGLQAAAQTEDAPAETYTLTVKTDSVLSATNGVVEISYDADVLELVGVTVSADFTSSRTESGCVVIGYVNAAELPAGTTVAELTFARKTCAGTDITVKTLQLNNLHPNTTLTETVESNCPCDPFTDLDNTKWYHEGIDFVLRNGYMTGTGSDKFSPNATLTRAQLVTILYSYAGKPAVSGSVSFTDVKPTAYYHDAVLWAVSNGITSGTASDKFSPNAVVTREQTAVFFYSFAKHLGLDTSARASLDGYTDQGKIAGYAREALSWAIASGLISGSTPTTVSPKDNATRAQAALILMKFDQL